MRLGDQKRGADPTVREDFPEEGMCTWLQDGGDAGEGVEGVYSRQREQDLPRQWDEFRPRDSRAVLRIRIKFGGVGQGSGTSLGRRAEGNLEESEQCGRQGGTSFIGSLLIRLPFYNGRWQKTNEETPSSLWFSVLMSSSPLEISALQSSPEVLDSRPWRDNGSSYPRQRRQAPG